MTDREFPFIHVKTHEGFFSHCQASQSAWEAKAGATASRGPMEDGTVVKHSIEKDEGHKAVFAGILLTLKSFSAKCG